MKPFNLEAAKRGDPIITGNLEPATYIGIAPTVTDPQSRLVVEVGGRVKVYGESGSYHEYPSDSDLFMATQKRTVWVNFQAINGFAYFYDSEEEANKVASETRRGGKAYPVEIDV